MSSTAMEKKKHFVNDRFPSRCQTCTSSPDAIGEVDPSLEMSRAVRAL